MDTQDPSTKSWETATPDVTRRLATFASDIRLADVPHEVREHVKLHVLDAVGCGIAGADSTLAQGAFRFLDLEHAPGPCRVLGDARRFGPATAAFANSVAMNALDYDDGHEVDGKGMGHPSATLVAAALSAGFTTSVDGPTFLAATAAAFEVNARLIAAIQPSIERFRLVYGVCQHQAVGAAVAYGRQLALTPERMENAIGFAATFANVASLRKYNWERRPLVSFKDFNAPAAEAGVRAVQLDACGLDGAKDALDGPSGFWRMIGSDAFDAAGCVAGLGDEWSLLQGSFKAYPVCRWMHTALEAFETVLVAEGLSREEVEGVTVHTSEGLRQHFMDRAPTTMVDAQFSFPFALAAMVLGITPAAEWYRDATLRRTDVAAFAAKVDAEFDAEIDAVMGGPERRPSGRVTVRARGRSYPSELIKFPRGTSERPMTRDDVIFKFIDNTAPTLGPVGAEDLAHKLLNIEGAGAIQPIFQSFIS